MLLRFRPLVRKSTAAVAARRWMSTSESVLLELDVGKHVDAVRRLPLWKKVAGVLAGGYGISYVYSHAELFNWTASITSTPATYASKLATMDTDKDGLTKEQLKTLALLYLDECFGSTAFVPVTEALDKWCEVALVKNPTQSVDWLMQYVTNNYIEQLHGAGQLKIKSVAQFKKALVHNGDNVVVKRIEEGQVYLLRCLMGDWTNDDDALAAFIFGLGLGVTGLLAVVVVAFN